MAVGLFPGRPYRDGGLATFEGAIYPDTLYIGAYDGAALVAEPTLRSAALRPEHPVIAELSRRFPTGEVLTVGLHSGNDSFAYASFKAAAGCAPMPAMWTTPSRWSAGSHWRRSSGCSSPRSFATAAGCSFVMPHLSRRARQARRSCRGRPSAHRQAGTDRASDRRASSHRGSGRAAWHRWRRLKPATVEAAVRELQAAGMVSVDGDSEPARWQPSPPPGNKLLEELELHGPHDFRHTLSTWLEDAGIPARVIDEIMGHQSGYGSRRSQRDSGSRIGTRYRHTTPEMAAQVAAAIEARLAIALKVAESKVCAKPESTDAGFLGGLGCRRAGQKGLGAGLSASSGSHVGPSATIARVRLLAGHVRAR